MKIKVASLFCAVLLVVVVSCGGHQTVVTISPQPTTVAVGTVVTALRRRRPYPALCGCDTWTLARIAGHSSIAISARYVHPSEDAVLTAMARLDGHKSGHSEKLPETETVRHSLPSA